MAYTDVPFLSYRNEQSKINVLAAFSAAYTEKVNVVWLGDSMSTLWGGAGNGRGNVLCRWIAQRFGPMHRTPILSGRTTNDQYSVVGTATNVSNNSGRVTSSPPIPANITGRQVGTNGMVWAYDPQLCFFTATNPALNIGLPSARDSTVMPTSGNVSFVFYMDTNPGAADVHVQGRYYGAHEGISVFSYSVLEANIDLGQDAATGSIVSYEVPIPSLAPTASQIYACQLSASSASSDSIGARFVAKDVTKGMSFDMFGEGGTDAQEYLAAWGGSMDSIETMSQPDIIVIRSGMNDAFSPTNNSTYNPGMRGLIDTIRAKWPGIPIIILGTTMSNDNSVNGYITLQPAIAAAIAADYENVVAVNTLLVYNPATQHSYDTEGLTVTTAWATATSYSVNDKRVGSDNRKYNCVVAHTSSSANQPPSVYWREVNRTTTDGVHQSIYGYEVETFGVLDRLLAEASQIGAQVPSLSPDALTQITDAVRTELATELARIDAAISSRNATAPDNASIAAIKAKTDNLPASPASVGDVPSASTNAAAVRTNLATELAEILKIPRKGQTVRWTNEGTGVGYDDVSMGDVP